MTDSNHSEHSASVDTLDHAGRFILDLVHRAGSAARDNTEKAFDTTRRLTAQIDAAGSRIKALEEDVKRYREMAHRAKLQATLLGEAELQLQDRTQEMNALRQKLADVTALLTASETEKNNARSALHQKQAETEKLASLFVKFVECVQILVRKIDTAKTAPDRQPHEKKSGYDWPRPDISTSSAQKPFTDWTW